MSLHDVMSTTVLGRLTSPEVLTFLAVGGAGYVVDVVSFNLLRSTPALASSDPAWARILAVTVAMVVTYFGNRLLTWRGQSVRSRHREVALFMLFNIIGLGFSVVCLLATHDVLGLTTRWDDNLSANVVGVALGTLFRFWSYKKFVFIQPSPPRRSSLPRPPGVRLGTGRRDTLSTS